MSDGGAESGILRPGASSRHFDFRSYEVGEELADAVENFWTVTWDLTDSYTAQVLPWPSVNLTVTNSEADVTGLVRRCYERHLTGHGYAVGARFRPGCFRPYLDFSVSELTDRHRPTAEVLGRNTAELRRAVADETDPAARVPLLSAFLVEARPEPDPTAIWLAELTELVAARRDITRVTQVAELAQVSVRRLQRLFADYVGAGPKWVIQRFRLQDAAARAAGPEPVDWAALAAELGFADQAHLTRAFTASIGTPPAAYATQARTR